MATLWDDFARYVYLPRLRDIDVLLNTVENGPGSLTWQPEGFAVAAGFDEGSGRCLGLVSGSHPGTVLPTTLLVRPDFALGQLEEEAERGDSARAGVAEKGRPPGGRGGVAEDGRGPAPPQPVTVFRGSVALDGRRPVKHFGDVTKGARGPPAVTAPTSRSVSGSWRPSPTASTTTWSARSPRTRGR